MPNMANSTNSYSYPSIFVYTEDQASKTIAVRHDYHFQVEALRNQYMSLHDFFLCYNGHGSICGDGWATKPKWPTVLNQHVEVSAQETCQLAVDIKYMKINFCCIKPLRFWCDLLLQHNLDQTPLKISAVLEMLYICTNQYGIH